MPVCVQICGLEVGGVYCFWSRWGLCALCTVGTFKYMPCSTMACRTSWAKASLKPEALSSSPGPAPSSSSGDSGEEGGEGGREGRGEGDEVEEGEEGEEEDKGLGSFVCSVVGRGNPGGFAFAEECEERDSDVSSCQ